MNFNLAEYGGGLSALVAGARPTPEMRTSIGHHLFAGAAHPAGALSGLWLYLDCFEESHVMAQEDSSPEGSLWHAIAHRREPDYGNSNYWYRHAGKHPVYPSILEEARRLATLMPEGGFRLGAAWDPALLVELCEAAATDRKREPFALALQRAEWQILFDYCARKRSV